MIEPLVYLPPGKRVEIDLEPAGDGLWRMVHPPSAQSLASLAGKGLIVGMDGGLPGEDRAHGGQGLYVDLVPASSWTQNARSALTNAQWTLLSGYVRLRAGACEACGRRGALEAHERWRFDEEAGIQRLARLVALCKSCHLATHYGFAVSRGWGERARRHLMKTTGLGQGALEAHIREAFLAWEQRSDRNWRVDLSMLQRAGLRVRGPGGTPCVGICEIVRGQCAGCQRTREEIGSWRDWDEARRKGVEATLGPRWMRLDLDVM